MGVCQDCLVEINGEAAVPACMTKVTGNANIKRHVSPSRLLGPPPAPQPLEAFTGSPDVLVIGGGPAGLTAAIAAARAGAERVIATDINPNAGAAAAENAKANGLGEKVRGLCCNLLEAIEPKPVFDVIMSSPPKHAGEPKDLADAGWHAGAGNKNILNLFEQARERLKPGGRVYLMISSDSDLDMYGKAIAKAGFKARLAFEHSIMFESFPLYELTQ
jgi:methylase of polypeptide subunit release factors